MCPLIRADEMNLRGANFATLVSGAAARASSSKQIYKTIVRDNEINYYYSWCLPDVSVKSRRAGEGRIGRGATGTRVGLKLN